jgi:hypothetical protein
LPKLIALSVSIYEAWKPVLLQTGQIGAERAVTQCESRTLRESRHRKASSIRYLDRAVASEADMLPETNQAFSILDSFF